MLTLGVAIVLLAHVGGCGPQAAGRAILSTKLPGREVKATLDGNGFISGTETSATINSGAGKIVVEQESVKLDDVELAKLPADAKLVEVDYIAGKLTISADGKPVATKEIKK
jgi:hypothetical protein